jgi:hypothetical protein
MSVGTVDNKAFVEDSFVQDMAASTTYNHHTRGSKEN